MIVISVIIFFFQNNQLINAHSKLSINKYINPQPLTPTVFLKIKSKKLNSLGTSNSFG